MSGIYFGEGISLKTYSAMTKAGKTVIKIELETADHYELAHILRDLDALEREQKAAKAARTAKPAKAVKPQLALPAPPLGLPYYGESD